MKTYAVPAMIVGVFVAYVLSTGPAAWYVAKASDSIVYGERLQQFDAIYAPLIWVAKNSAPAGTALEWYAWLWMPREQRHLE